MKALSMISVRLVVISYLPFLIFMVLYYGSTSNNLSVAHDSVGYFSDIARGVPDYHPHHLLYEPFSSLWLNLFSRLFSDNLQIVISINSIFGALIVQVTFMLMRRRLDLSISTSFLGAATVGLTFGYWFYSVTVEVYIIPIFFLVLSLHILSKEKISRATFFGVGVLHGFAMLFHQVHFLFLVVVFVRLLSCKESFNVKFGYFLIYSSIATLLVVGTYGYVAVLMLKLQTVQGVMDWFFGYAHNNQYWHSPLNAGTYFKAVVGFGRAVVGGHFLFGMSELSGLLLSAFPGQGLDDEKFLVRNVPTGVLYGLTVASVLLGVSVSVPFLLKKSVRIQERFSKNNRVVLMCVFAWLATYSLFFLFWEPHNPEFWIPQVFCVVVIYTYLVESRHKAMLAGVFLSISSLLLASINLIGSILPCKFKENDYYAVSVEPITTQFDSRTTLVIIGDWWPIQSFFRLNGFGHVISTTQLFESGQSIDRKILLEKSRHPELEKIVLYRDVIFPRDSTILELGESYKNYLAEFVHAQNISSKPDFDIYVIETKEGGG